jgi:hypothetical protein
MDQVVFSIRHNNTLPWLNDETKKEEETDEMVCLTTYIYTLFDSLAYTFACPSQQ